MIPSPDWIVGVSKETLCEENWQDKHFFGKNGEGETLEQYFFFCSTWVNYKTFDLVPVDIGTQPGMCK